MYSIKYADEILFYGRLLYQNGMIAGFDGNLSIRGENDILITPGGEPKGFLMAEDLVQVDMSGNKIAGSKNPSSELAMHLQAYSHRSDINACCHAHPPYATAFAAAGKNLPKNILPEIIIIAGDIQLVEYIPTGVAEEWKKLSEYLPGHEAFLLQNHGVLTLGRNMKEAYYRMEAVEHFARIAYIGSQVGELRVLEPNEVVRLGKIREAFLKGSKS